MKIESVDEELLSELRYLNAARGGGTGVDRLPVQRAWVGPLADELDAIVVCSDLQGIVPGPDREAQLLGVAVAELLDELAFDGAIPPAARTGVILAGDLYSVPEANKRGGFGDVADVWRAFAERFAWVAGVAGNHDDVTNVPSLGEHVHLLDGTTVEVDGLRIGGVGGIIGSKQKPGRRTEVAYVELLEHVIDEHPDVLVLHEGPHGDERQPGNAVIRGLVDVGEIALTICGHDHWKQPLAEVASGQILNVDARVMILVARG